MARELRRLTRLLTVVLGTSGCAIRSGSVESPIGSADPSAGTSIIPGVPNRPALVTVVPFYWKPNEDENEKTKVVIPVEINHRRGLVVVDLGDPGVDLNRTFLRPDSTGEVDTVLATDTMNRHRSPNWNGMDTAHATMRIGTLQVDFIDPALGNTQRRLNVSLDHQWGNFAWVFAPRLGNIGLSVLEQFETIIDYQHRRLILIRLDKEGRRLVDVPAYVPKGSAPLIDIPFKGWPGYNWWGIAVQPNQTLDTLNAAKNTQLHMIDTGAGDNVEGHDPPVLGYPFLNQLGVVGFNHRTHQFLLYR